LTYYWNKHKNHTTGDVTLHINCRCPKNLVVFFIPYHRVYFTYLGGFDFERSQVWIVEQGGGVYVDGRLVPARLAQLGAGQHTPGPWACNKKPISVRYISAILASSVCPKTYEFIYASNNFNLYFLRRRFYFFKTCFCKSFPVCRRRGSLYEQGLFDKKVIARDLRYMGSTSHRSPHG